MFSFWNKTETWPAKGLTILGLDTTFPFGESFQSVFRRCGRERKEKEERGGGEGEEEEVEEKETYE